MNVRGLFKKDSLGYLRRAGLPVGCVIDVGVLDGTPDLMELFPDRHHLLVECVEEFAGRIHENYRDIPHTLASVAASDVDGEALLETRTVREGETVTHAWLSQAGNRPVTMSRIDTLVNRLGIPGPYLLKIDVDGADVPARVIEGAAGIMNQTSAVICEMTGTAFVDLSNRIAKFGFDLWDIVESCYYKDVFWQADAVFVRRDLISSVPGLMPDVMKEFDGREWWPSHRSIKP